MDVRKTLGREYELSVSDPAAAELGLGARSSWVMGMRGMMLGGCWVETKATEFV